MGTNWVKPGANYVPAYQSSGLPYVTRSVQNELNSAAVVKHEFPYVTRFFVIGNNSEGTLRVGFTENGVNAAETANYFCVKPFTSGALRYEIRCKALYFKRDGNDNAGFEIMAGLTNIGEFPTLTGSLISVGFGAPTTSSWPGVG